MSKNSFKVKKGLTISPVDPADIVNPEAGDLIIDSTDNSKLKKYDESKASFEEISGSAKSGDLAPDIEDSTPIVTNVVAVKDAVTFLPIDANTESLKATFSGSDGSIRLQSAVSADLEGAQGLISFWIKTSVQDLSVYTTVNGVQESQAAPVASVNKWRQYEIPTVLGGANYGFEILANGTVSGDVFIDDIKVELAPAGYVQNVEVVSAWESYTPVTQGVGTITNNTLEWRQVGSNIDIGRSFVSGATTATEARIGLPSGYTAKSSQFVGRLIKNAGASAYPNNYALFSVSGQNYLIVTDYDKDSTVSPVAALNGNSFASSTNELQIKASIPVNELSATPQAFISQKTGFPVVTGAGNAGQSITANVTDIPFIETEDSRGYWDGDSFTPTRAEDAGYYLVSGSLFLSASNTLAINAYINGVEDLRLNQIVTDTIHSFTGIVKLSKDNSLSIRVNQNITLSSNTKLHHIHIQKIPDEAYIAGLFSQIENVDATLTAETANEFNFNASTSGVVTGDDYDFINGNGTCVSGNHTYTFNTGIFTVAPSCGVDMLNSDASQNMFAVRGVNSGLATVTFTTVNNSGAASCENVKITCHKRGADVNKSIKGAIVNASQTMSDELKCLYNRYSEDEVKCGLWNGEQLYRRCFTVASDISVSGTVLATWDSTLELVNSTKINNVTNDYVIDNTSLSSANRFIFYRGTTGEIFASLSGGLIVYSGTRFCAEYVK